MGGAKGCTLHRWQSKQLEPHQDTGLVGEPLQRMESNGQCLYLVVPCPMGTQVANAQLAKGGSYTIYLAQARSPLLQATV